MPFAAAWMQLEIIILTEISQKEKDKYHDITYMWNLKQDTNEPIYETERVSWRTGLWLSRGRAGGEGKGWELGLADANQYISRMDRQQGPTHRELYSISYDKPKWKRIKKSKKYLFSQQLSSI